MNHNATIHSHRLVNSAIYMLALAFCLCAAATLYWLAVDHFPLSLRSRHMLSNSNMLHTVFKPGLHPPGYGLLLYVVKELSIPVRWLNFGLYLSGLSLLITIVRRFFPTIGLLRLLLLHTVLVPNYYIFSQYVAEALIFPGALAVFLLLMQYQSNPRWLWVILLGLMCALLYLARYHPIFWLTPIVVFHLLHSAAQSWRMRLFHTVVYLLLAALPVTMYMMHNYTETGYLTGMDRFSYDKRILFPQVTYFAEETGFWDNLRLTLKTYYVDFLMPLDFARHKVLHDPLPLTGSTISGMLMAALAFLAGFTALVKSHELAGLQTPTLARCWHWLAGASAPAVLLEFWSMYLLSTLVLWTISNNDPIYTKFLFPSYIYALLLGFVVYERLRHLELPGVHRYAVRSLWGAFYLALLGSNVYQLAVKLRWLN